MHLPKGQVWKSGTPLYVIRIHHAKDVCIAIVCRVEGLSLTIPLALKSNYSNISFPDLFGKCEIKANAPNIGISPRNSGKYMNKFSHNKRFYLKTAFSPSFLIEKATYNHKKEIGVCNSHLTYKSKSFFILCTVDIPLFVSWAIVLIL